MDQTTDDFEYDTGHKQLKDTAFSVYSDPKFLYLIGKICARSQLPIYSDLALQSFHDYLLIVTYYKDYMRTEDFRVIKIKTYLWLARVFLNSEQFEYPLPSLNIVTLYRDCQKLLNYVQGELIDDITSQLFKDYENLFCQMHKA